MGCTLSLLQDLFNILCLIEDINFLIANQQLTKVISPCKICFLGLRKIDAPQHRHISHHKTIIPPCRKRTSPWGPSTASLMGCPAFRIPGSAADRDVISGWRPRRPLRPGMGHFERAPLPRVRGATETATATVQAFCYRKTSTWRFMRKRQRAKMP